MRDEGRHKQIKFTIFSKRKLVSFLILIGICVMGVFGHIRYLEEHSVFFPTRNVEFTPKEVNLSYEDIYIKTDDGLNLHGWLVPCDNSQQVILFCHGNSGNIGDRVEKINILRSYGVNVLIFDYRGYGKSEGIPSEKKVYLDAKAAYDYLIGRRLIKAENIIVYGESLGGAIAVNLCSQVSAGGLILEGAFSRGKDMAKILYPYLPSIITPNLFDSLTKIRKIYVNKLFIHSKDDEVVPFSLAVKLYDAAPKPKQFVEIKGPHNTIFLDSLDKYKEAIKSFLLGRVER